MKLTCLNGCNSRFAGYGSSPTFGISISPWVLILGAAVLIVPKVLPAILKSRRK